MSAAATEPKKTRKPWPCKRCGEIGHYAKSCDMPQLEALAKRKLYRCLLCQWLGWEAERNMHIFDHHGSACSVARLREWFNEAKREELKVLDTE